MEKIPASENKMGVMPMNRLLLSMSVPIMVSMLVQAFYNVVDSYFVSQVSQDALNAVSLAFPVQNLMIAVSVGTGVGFNGNYYIMKADDNNKLVKQYIATGKIMYGYSIEVKGGLSMKDRICFPYGKEVKEGVRTKDSTEVLYPEYY